MKTEVRTDLTFEGLHRGHYFDLSRESESDRWYIRVSAPDGCRTYDGWWRDSEGKSVDEAITEACHGSCINPPEAGRAPGAGA